MKCCGLGRMLWPCSGVASEGRASFQPGVLLPAVLWAWVTAEPLGGQKALPGSSPGCRRPDLLPARSAMGAFVCLVWPL